MCLIHCLNEYLKLFESIVMKRGSIVLAKAVGLSHSLVFPLFATAQIVSLSHNIFQLGLLDLQGPNLGFTEELIMMMKFAIYEL